MDPVAELLWELFDEATEGMDESTRTMLCKTTIKRNEQNKFMWYPQTLVDVFPGQVRQG